MQKKLSEWEDIGNNVRPLRHLTILLLINISWS